MHHRAWLVFIGRMRLERAYKYKYTAGIVPISILLYSTVRGLTLHNHPFSDPQLPYHAPHHWVKSTRSHSKYDRTGRR